MPYSRPSNGTEKAKKARADWDKENMVTVGCKLRKDIAERFKEKCRAEGKVPNTVLREFIIQYLGEDAPAPSQAE